MAGFIVVASPVLTNSYHFNQQLPTNQFRTLIRPMSLPDLEARWRDQLKKPVRDFGVIEYIFIRNLLLMENVTTEVWPILGMNMASEHTKFGPPQPKLFTFASNFSFNLNL